MSHDLFAVTATMMDEIAEAISELGFRRELGELVWPALEPEWKSLTALLRQRAALISEHAPVPVDLCESYALLILDAMVAQHQHDLRLASRSQPPFGPGQCRR